MSSYYFRSGLADRLKALYRQQPKTFFVYLIHIPLDNATKVGRTKRLAFRIRNLRAGIYRDHHISIIKVHSAQESLALEKHIHKALASRRMVREWFAGVSPADVEAVLATDYPHLYLEPYELHPSGLIVKPYHTSTVVTSATSFDVALV
jgi:hypothetical protein